MAWVLSFLFSCLTGYGISFIPFSRIQEYCREGMKKDPLSKIRLVRCPGCKKILPEPADVPFYICGGCRTILRATHYKGPYERRKTVTEGSDSVQNNQLEHCARGGEPSSSSNAQLISSAQCCPADQQFLDPDEDREQNLEITNREEPSNLVPEIGEAQRDHRSLEQHGDCKASSFNEPMEQPAKLAPGNLAYGVCNSCGQPLRKFDMPRSDDGCHFAAGTSTMVEDTEDEGESSILPDWGIMTLRTTESADIYDVLGTEVQKDGELDGITYFRDMIVPVITDILHDEAYGEQEHANNPEAHIHSSIRQQKKCGVIPSGSNSVVESLAPTMVSKRYSEHVCMEAVYPPYLAGKCLTLGSTYKRRR